jgi:hypothetical protein
MRKRLFNWQGQRFVYLSLEGESGRPLPQQSSDLFARAGTELATLGLSLLRNTVRTRIFGRTATARTDGSAARAQALVGRSRAAGASYVCVPHFCSAADVALDLFAMAAPAGNPPRHVSEHEPEQSFIRHLVWGPMVFLPGMTCERYPGLQAQYTDILSRAGALLKETGCDWGNVVRVSFFPAPGRGSGRAAGRRGRAGAVAAGPGRDRIRRGIFAAGQIGGDRDHGPPVRRITAR